MIPFDNLLLLFGSAQSLSVTSAQLNKGFSLAHAVCCMCSEKVAKCSFASLSKNG